MKRHILIYGLVGGALISLLKLIEYRALVIDRSIEIYGGLIAATFAILGIWLGVALTRRHSHPPVTETCAPTTQPGAPKNPEPATIGLTPRELEILSLIAQGLSNREIADKLFVSENTVKTHSSRLFGKLGAKRRTQAVQLGKSLGLLA